MTQSTVSAATSRVHLIAAFAAVYVLWGSTYVAIKFAVETLPPFVMAGARFTAAGLILLAWTHWRGAPAATWRQWKNAAVGGAFLIMISNGLVCWSEKRVDSSLAALMVATVPLWMMTLDWLRPGGKRPRPLTGLGVLAGLVGVAILVWPETGAVRIDPLGILALIVATLAWSIGSLFTRTADMGGSMLKGAAMQMLCGGVLQFAVGGLRGEWNEFDALHVTLKSVLSLVWLLVAGSLVGFTAYMWLLRHTSTTRAATYAYVNPIVALILGAFLAQEELTPRRLIGACVVVGGVVLSLTFASTPPPRPASSEPPPDSPPVPPAVPRRI
ncbi:MAG: EamA family transporter [Planctomycetes bacterium]|nr:EamA family transporter [Planctomycetota bacterium]